MDSGSVPRLRVVWLLPSEAQASHNRKGTKVTRKDYERIASALRSYSEEIEANPSTLGAGIIRRDTIDDIVEMLVDIFTEDNPRFTPQRFRQACR